MSSKIILAPLLVLLLGNSSVWGQQGGFSCPNVANWKEGDIYLDGWNLIHVTGPIPKNTKWYAYDAWILRGNADYPTWRLQCNYISLPPGTPTTKKTPQLVFGKSLDPKAYTFAPSRYFIQKPSGDLECTPWKAKAPLKIENKYPEECQFLPFNQEHPTVRR